MPKSFIFQCLLLFMIQQHCVYAMKQADYVHLFEICKNNEHGSVHQFIKTHKDNTQFDINHQNEHGETALVYSASWNAWDSVDALLEHKADKNIKDQYSQSLFYKSFYTEQAHIFQKMLEHHSQEEINTECKTIALSRNVEYQVIPAIHDLITDVLEGKKKPLEIRNSEATAFLMCCTNNYLPYIISLLTKNRNFTRPVHMARLENGSFYDLYPKTLFVIREAFNNEGCIPFSAALIDEYLQTHVEIDDVRQIIKHYYIQLFGTNLFETVEALLWEPICIKACELNNVKKTEKYHCLLHILLLSQKEKTKFNQQWYLNAEKNKEQTSKL